MRPADPRLSRQTCEGHSVYAKGCDDCRDAQRIYRRARRKLHAMGTATSMVSAIGAQRRIAALHALGWPYAEIGRRLNTTRQSIYVLMKQDRVAYATDLRVKHLYDEMWNQVPQGQTRHEKTVIGRSKRYASAKNFEPPLAWDDHELDQPFEIRLEEVV